MDYPRAIVIYVIAHLATLAVASVALLVMGSTINASYVPTANEILMSMVIALGLTIIAADVYFRRSKVRASQRHGFLFGVLAIVVAFGLDLVLFGLILLQGRNPMPFLSAAYTHWFFVPMIGLALVGTTLVGRIKANREQPN